MSSPLRPLLLIMRGFSGRIILSLLLGIATICAGIGLLGTSGYLIASAALHPSIAELQVAIVGVRFFGLSRAIFRYLERVVSHSVNLRIVSKLRSDLYQRIEPGAPANLASQHSGDLLEKMIGDIETLENFFVRVFTPIIVAAVFTVGLGVFIGGYFYQLGLIVCLGLLINGFILPRLSLWASREYTKRIAGHNSIYSSLAVEYIQGLEDLATNNALRRWQSRLEVENQGLKKAQLAQNTLTAAQNALNLLVMNLTILTAVVLTVPLVSKGTLSGVSLAVILLVVSAGFEATIAMPQAARVLTSSREAARRLFTLSTSEPTGIVSNLAEKQEPSSELRLNHISFRYPGEKQYVLADINLVLKQGQIKAIVGLSGSGKSTLFDLLLRFWEPTSGRISLDEKPIEIFGADSWRQHFGVIGQSVFLFNTSLRENLLLAEPAARETRLLDVLGMAGLEKWFSGLPDGLDTWVGEHGLRLSAGERQRLAIARILLTDPDFILLDEPTANLDPMNEIEILKTLTKVFAQKGILMVTHRLDLLVQVDEIIVLDKGRIVEKGVMQELISHGGVFQKMISIQKDMIISS